MNRRVTIALPIEDRQRSYDFYRSAPGLKPVGKERMNQGGGSIVAAPEEQAWGFTAVATDPDGHAWQIVASSGSR